MRAINKRTAGLLSASALALGLVAIAQPAIAGISSTRHNLSTSNTSPGQVKVTAGTAEVCVFCHTPHASNTDVTAPLWNKDSTSSTYSSYSSLNSATFDATQAGPGNVSLACLTCHDGTQAMDNIINASGSGAYDSTGGGTTGLTYTWASGQRVDAQGRMLNGSASRIAMLGTDLRNDHPIGMNYCAASLDNANITTPSTSCGDPDFNTGVGGAGVRAYIETGGAGFQKTDLPLYNAGAAVGIRVECATCHDPHTSNVTFLRTLNTGSAVCLACHNK